MKAGIKIGLADYKERIPRTKASVCEVYFRFDYQDRYRDLFRQLADKGIQAGLHFWGLVQNKFLYNLAYPNAKIQQETLALVKETIDIAKEQKCRYVNIHPGNYLLLEIDLDKMRYGKLKDKVAQEEGNSVLFENTRILHQYAQKRKVLYLTETVLCRDNPIWYNERSRLNPIDAGYVPVAQVLQLADNGYYVTNDFGHTLCDEISDDRNYLYQRLFEKTVKLAKQTKLIHPNTTKPPFNGVDTHNGLTPEDFSQNVLPTKKQLIELLSLFKKRNDVWLIPEPIKNHEENFQILKNLLKKIENK